MKLVSRYIERDGTGRVALIPENPEDMWHAYNLISHGDTIRASTIRKVQTESATGSSSSSRVRTMLTVEVETIDFDTQACVLRLKGRNVEENPYVKMGAYHTVDIEPNRKFSLTKACWDIVALERIDMACDPSQNADVAAVIMHEGLANVCLVTGAMTLVRAKIDVTIPRKRKGSTSQHEKVSILEVLADPAVTSRMADTKAMAEVKALENFYAVLQTEPSRAFYGLKHVLKANEGQAIDTLLVSDNLFRSQSVEERKTYVKLVESVRDNGGTTRIFSSLHVSGEQLIQLTGVAAILRFPMPELEEEPLDSDEDS
nr:EOG090X07BV [Daphnia magna]